MIQLQHNSPSMLWHTTSTFSTSESSSLSPKPNRTLFADHESTSWTPPSSLHLALINLAELEHTCLVSPYPNFPTSPCHFTSASADPLEVSSSSYLLSPLYTEFNLAQVVNYQPCENALLLFADNGDQAALTRALEWSSAHSINAVETMQSSPSCLLTARLGDPIGPPVAKPLPLIPLPDIGPPEDITNISIEEPMSIDECVDILSIHKSLNDVSFHCAGESSAPSSTDMAQKSLVPFLESLNLDSEVDVAPLFERLNFLAITRLTLAGSGGSSDVSSLNIPWESITHLALSYDLSISVLKKIFDYCTNLQSFDYSGQIISADKDPSLIPIHAPTLSHLKISRDSAGYKNFINSLFSFKSDASPRSIDVPQIACLHTIESKITDIRVRNPLMMKDCLDIISKHTLLESAEFTLTNTEMETAESTERSFHAYGSTRPTLRSLKFNAEPRAERLLAPLQLSNYP
ncbi:hypothetical protein BDQ12DRAFT_738328 [Crucibulum laeve]|uniref:Uncharacterized protein n=1 Tax=Crucibulum laeve TaxID=68775 RepID=A0A5C3LN27_9AGAR|nr:hypothetical protein BDQ12DRAFT_738328 [Crucibulum laeve]